MNNMLKKGLVLGVALSVLSLSGCGSSDDGDAKDTTSLNVINYGIVDTLDPQLMSSTWDKVISANVFEGLTTIDNQGKVVPGLAKSWDVNSDASKFTFHLRDNLKWSDGTPITAKNVVFSFQHLFDPKTASKYSSLLSAIKNATDIIKGKLKPTTLGVKALDDKTVEISLNGPTPYFPSIITHSTGALVPQHVIEKFGNDWSKVKNVIGAGPYVVKSFVPSGDIVLEANPNYYDAKNVTMKHIRVVQTSEIGTLMKEFRSGNVDYGNAFKTSEQETIEKARPGTTHIGTYPSLWYMTTNQDVQKLQDSEVRHAIGMALDREKILKSIDSKAKPAYNFVPPGMGGIGKPAKVYWRDWDMKKRAKIALEILKKHGYTKKHPLKLDFETMNSEASKRIFVAISQDLKPYNIVFSLNGNETKTHYTQMENRNFEVAFAGWVLDYNDAFDFLFLASPKYGGANNYSGYNNAEFNGYMDKSASESNPEKRAELLTKAEQKLLDDLPNIPLYYDITANLVSTDLGGYYDNLMDAHPFKYYFYKSTKK